MSKKIDKINELLELLDEQKDFMLVMTLKQEITKDKVKYLSKHSVTPKELVRAERGLYKSTNTFLKSQDEYYVKAKKILDSQDCNSCVRAIEHTYKSCGNTYSFLNQDYDSNVCDSCNSRCDAIESALEKRNDINYTNIEKALNENKDLIKYKAIINKINLKIQKIKNYDAS